MSDFFKMKGLQLDKEKLDKKVIECTNCDLCKLEFNDNTQYYKGYGKLLGKLGRKTPKIMIIGLNPSHNRWAGLIHHFSGGVIINENHDNNVGAKFLDIFKKLKVFDECYITNAVKCSTDDNKITDKNFEDCYHNLFDEIEMIKPQLIFACGNQVYDFFKLNSINKINVMWNLEKIHHPNYYFTYNTHKINEYTDSIIEILIKYKFI